MRQAKPITVKFATLLNEILNSLRQATEDANLVIVEKSHPGIYPINCPACGSVDTTDEITFKEIRDDVPTGFCFSCGHVWCLECGETLCLSTVSVYAEIRNSCQENKNTPGGCKIPIWKCDLIRAFLEKFC